MRPVVALAVAVALFAWGRLLHSHVTNPSPAHEVRFLGVDGAATERAHCHGAGWMFGGALWWFCTQDVDGESTDYLTRYDLKAGTARFVRAVGHEWRGISAAVAHPQGGAVIVTGDKRVVHWQPDGAWKDLGLEGYKWAPSLGVRDGAVELVFGVDQETAVIARLEGDAWTQRTLRLPQSTTLKQRFAGGVATPTGWRLNWLRFAETPPAGPIEVEVHGLRADGRATPVATLKADPETDDFFSRMGARVELVGVDYLARAGGVPRWSSPPGHEWVAGGWQGILVPPEFRGLLVRRDVVLDGPRAGVTLVSDVGERHARVAGQWFAIGGERGWRVDRLTDDLQGVATAGTPAVDRFWVGTGLALLPDEDDGYWLMGGLGEAYVHLDANLQRTDAHGLFARIGRALAEDRAKRNSDFYDSLGFARRGAFLWVLFAFPLLCLAVAPTRRWTLAAWIYLVGAALGGYWFWRLSGVFF